MLEANEVVGTDHEARCDQVHRRLQRIVKARGALDAAEAEALREAQALGLWRRYGHASLLEYMELRLGYSPRAALERLRVAHAIVELPQIAEALTNGDLSFSGARELTRVATTETEAEWLGAVADKNLREVEKLVSGHAPGDLPDDPVDASLLRETLRFDVKPETYALLRQVQKILDAERGERLDDDALITTLCRQVLDVRATTRSSAAYQVAVTVCETCKRGQQDGAGIVVDVSAPAIERALCDAHHIGSIDTHPNDSIERATHTVSPRTRRKVLRRDHGRCRVPACRCARNIDIHHVVPQVAGGKHTADNLVTLCEGHHLALHEGSLAITGSAPNLVFTRRPSSYEDATRAVGPTKDPEVSHAMKNVRTHVGSAKRSEHTLEEWIEIALRNYPRPIT